MRERTDLDPLRAEVELLRVEADRLGADLDPLRVAALMIVGVNYYPETSAVARYTTAMARDLAAVAERVQVLTGRTEPPGPRRLGQARRRADQDGRVHLVRHRHHSPNRPGALGRARYERSFLRAVLSTPIRNTPDVVIGVLPSIGAAVAAARLAERLRAPLLLVVQDLDVAQARDGGLIGGALARGQVEALRQAARVVLSAAELEGPVIALGVAKSRITILDERTPAPVAVPSPRSARDRLTIEANGLVVVHIGNIGFGQDVPTLVRAARQISDVQFLLVGEGRQRETLEAAAADRPGVQFRDSVSASEYPVLLAAADILVVTERSGHPDRTLPSRLQSYLRAGRPIVAAINAEGDADRLLQSVGAAAVTVPAGDDVALAAVLTRLRDDERERARLTAAARTYAAAVGHTPAGYTPAGYSAAGHAAAGTRGRSADGLRTVVRALLTDPR
jgi:colanic acid biosynthesis glycosyl transferase WcaI